MEYPHVFVVLMGLGIVFFGLICLIILTTIMGAVLKGKGDKNKTGTKAQPQTAKATAPGTAILKSGPAGASSASNASSQNAPEIMDRALVAAMATAIAEQLGVDVLGVKILSIRKI